MQVFTGKKNKEAACACPRSEGRTIVVAKKLIGDNVNKAFF